MPQTFVGSLCLEVKVQDDFWLKRGYCSYCFKRSKTLKHGGHVLQQQSHSETGVFLLMEALLKERTLLLSFLP